MRLKIFFNRCLINLISLNIFYFVFVIAFSFNIKDHHPSDLIRHLWEICYHGVAFEFRLYDGLNSLIRFIINLLLNFNIDRVLVSFYSLISRVRLGLSLIIMRLGHFIMLIIRVRLTIWPISLMVMIMISVFFWAYYDILAGFYMKFV